MSRLASDWALNHAPVRTAAQRLLLLELADGANRYGVGIPPEDEDLQAVLMLDSGGVDAVMVELMELGLVDVHSTGDGHTIYALNLGVTA